MSIITSKTRAAAAQDATLANINLTGGPTAGTLKLYTGSAPANVAASPTGTLLATCTLGHPTTAAFGATSTSTLVATGDTTAGYFAQDTSPVASGTIGYWRLLDYAGAVVLQGTVGTVGSGADIEFNTLSVIAGVLVQIVTMTSTVSGIT